MIAKSLACVLLGFCIPFVMPHQPRPTLKEQIAIQKAIFDAHNADTIIVSMYRR